MAQYGPAESRGKAIWEMAVGTKDFMPRPAFSHDRSRVHDTVERRRCGFLRTATVRERPLCGAAALRPGPSLTLGVLKEPFEASQTRHPAPFLDAPTTGESV